MIIIIIIIIIILIIFYNDFIGVFKLMLFGYSCKVIKQLLNYVFFFSSVFSLCNDLLG